jgi:hypothetical protein
VELETLMDMPPAPIVRFMSQALGHGDCTVSALAMCLGISYEEALVAIACVQKNVLKAGCSWSEVRRAAKRLGATLVERRAFSLDDDSEDSGILSVTLADGTPHAVYFTHGLIFDGRTGCVWESDTYRAVHIATATSMLVRKS